MFFRVGPRSTSQKLSGKHRRRRRRHRVYVVSRAGVISGGGVTVIIEVFAQGCSSFSRADITDNGEGADLKTSISERFRQDLPYGVFFDVGNLPVVEIWARGKLPHPCAKTPMITVSCALYGTELRPRPRDAPCAAAKACQKTTQTTTTTYC